MIVSLYKYPYIPFAENYYWIILAKVLLKRVLVSNMKKIGHELCTLERILHGNKFIRKIHSKRVLGNRVCTHFMVPGLGLPVMVNQIAKFFL